TLGTTRPSAATPAARDPGPSDQTIELHGAGSSAPLAPGGSGPTIATGPAPSPSEVRRVSDLTVVLVEPSRVQAGIVKRYLAELGIDRVHAASSGREALDVAGRVRADVLLCAMYLPDMPGPELAATLLADPDRPGVGFVLATSEPDADGALSLLLDSPRVALLQKPFDLRTLA